MCKLIPRKENLIFMLDEFTKFAKIKDFSFLDNINTLSCNYKYHPFLINDEMWLCFDGDCNNDCYFFFTGIKGIENIDKLYPIYKNKTFEYDYSYCKRSSYHVHVFCCGEDRIILPKHMEIFIQYRIDSLFYNEIVWNTVKKYDLKYKDKCYIDIFINKSKDIKSHSWSLDRFYDIYDWKENNCLYFEKYSNQSLYS